MQATLGKKLRFSDVVFAIGGTAKSLRLWLQRDLVKIDTPKPANGGWTEYSFRDIAILALTRSVANFGVDVPTANEIANTIMGDHFYPRMNHVSDPDNMPAGALAMMFANQRLYLFREGDTWHMKLVALWESGLNPARNEGFDPQLPSGVAMLRCEHEPASVFLSIDVESVLRTAFERAMIGSDADTWTNEEESMKAAIQKLTITIQDATPSRDDD
jgi:hypothetical protein